MARTPKAAKKTAEIPQPSLIDISSDLLAIEKWIADGKLDGRTAIHQMVGAIGSCKEISGAFIALNEKELHCVASIGRAPEAGTILTANPMFDECILGHRMCRYQRASADPRVDRVLQAKLGFESAILLPLKSRSTVLGILAVFSTSPIGLDEKDAFVLGTAATVAGHVVSYLKDPVAQVAASREAMSSEAAPRAASTVPASLPMLPSQQKQAQTQPRSSGGKVAFVILAVLALGAAGFVSVRLMRPGVVALGKKTPPAQQPDDRIEETLGMPALVNAKSRSDAGSKITGGALKQRVAPAYPENALRRGLSGEVKMMVNVSENGIVTDVRVLSGDPQLASAAAAAISHWRFSPFLADGRPTPVQLPLVIAFRSDGHDHPVSSRASTKPS